PRRTVKCAERRVRRQKSHFESFGPAGAPLDRAIVAPFGDDEMGRRELTEAQKAFIQRNGKHVTLIWQPFLLGLLFVALGAPGTFGFEVPLPDGVALVDSETGQPSAPL